MHTDYDPDDNFARSFPGSTDLDEDAAVEAVVWQFLLLINPDDEEGALQQFATWRESPIDEDDVAARLREATDWKSTFHVAADDPASLIDALDELAARFDLRIDWGTDDPSDPDFLADTDVPALLGTAFDRLREHHYTVWSWEADEDAFAGAIAHRRDDESLPLVAQALGLHARPGAS